jgi:hypothetical protein
MISKQSKGAWNSSNVFAFLLHHYVGPHLKDPTAAARVIVCKSCGELSLLHKIVFLRIGGNPMFPLFLQIAKKIRSVYYKTVFINQYCI